MGSGLKWTVGWDRLGHHQGTGVDQHSGDFDLVTANDGRDCHTSASYRSMRSVSEALWVGGVRDVVLTKGGIVSWLLLEGVVGPSAGILYGYSCLECDGGGVSLVLVCRGCGMVGSRLACDRYVDLVLVGRRCSMVGCRVGLY